MQYNIVQLECVVTPITWICWYQGHATRQQKVLHWQSGTLL